MNDEQALKNNDVWHPSLRKGVEHNLPFVPVLKHSCNHTRFPCEAFHLLWLVHGEAKCIVLQLVVLATKPDVLNTWTLASRFPACFVTAFSECLQFLFVLGQVRECDTEHTTSKSFVARVKHYFCSQVKAVNSICEQRNLRNF